MTIIKQENWLYRVDYPPTDAGLWELLKDRFLLFRGVTIYQGSKSGALNITVTFSLLSLLTFGVYLLWARRKSRRLINAWKAHSTIIERLEIRI